MTFPRLAAYRDWGLLALRVAIGIIFIVHGLAKVPILSNLEPMMQRMGGMALFFGVQGIVEIVTGAALIVGLAPQLVSALFVCIMIGAIYSKTFVMPTGFTSSRTTGWELDFALLAANLALVLVGPGRFTLWPRRNSLE